MIYVLASDLSDEAAAEGLAALTAFLEGETDELVLPEGYEIVEV